MNKILFTINLLFFCFISNAQIWTLEGIKLKKGSEQEYLQIEKFWKKVKKIAIDEGKQRAWYVMKNITKVEEGKERRYDYFVFNFYTDEDQMNQDVDFLAMAMRAHKGKLSKSKIRYNYENWSNPRESTNVYTLKRLDRTINSTPISKNTPLYIYPMVQKNEDYERYEMEYFKKEWHESEVLDYRKAFWAFDKVIDRTEKANKSITHFTFEKYTSENPPESKRFDWNNLTFEQEMMLKHGVASREGYPEFKLEFVMDWK